MGEVGSGVFEEVGAVELIGLLDCSRVGRVPSVVAPRVEKGLVYSTAHERLIHNVLDFWAHPVHAEHVVQRVVVVLQPEAVQRLHVTDGLGGAGQAVGVGTVHDVLWTLVDGTRSGCQVAAKPLVPILEAVELLIIGIRQEEVFIINAVAGEPSVFEAIEAGLRFLRVEEGTVDVKDTLEVEIDLWVAEKALPVVVIEQSEEEDREGHADDFCVGGDGWRGGDCVDMPHDFVDGEPVERGGGIIVLHHVVETALQTHADDGVGVYGVLELPNLTHHLGGLLVVLGAQLDVVAIFGDCVEVHRTHSSSA